MTSVGQRINLALRLLLHQFFSTHCTSRATSLAYTTLLSILPFMLVVFYVLSWVPIFSGAGQALQQFVGEHFVAHSAHAVWPYLDQFVKHLNTLSPVSMLFLLLTVVLMIYNLVNAFNAIWQISVTRHFALAFGTYLLVLLFAPLLLATLFVTLSYFASFPLLAELKRTPFIHGAFIILPYLAEWLLFTLFNWLLPSCSVRFRYAALAGLFTLCLFECAKYGFVIYLHYFPTYRLIYGALAAIPIFLLWLYISWLIILLGAIVCWMMTRSSEWMRS